MRLNGDTDGEFKAFLDGIRGEPRVAWYPSAGYDLRDLMYLHPDFPRVYKRARKLVIPERAGENMIGDPPAPDLFLHTDYGQGHGAIPGKEVLFEDPPYTRMRVVHREQLSTLTLPDDEEILAFPRHQRFPREVFFLLVEVQSDLLGTFQQPLIYADVENESFIAREILPAQVRFSHVIHIRYGGGLGGGGHASGGWIRPLLPDLGCEVFITDDHENPQIGDQAALKLYPNLNGSGRPVKLEEFRLLPEANWSMHGHVHWNRVDRTL